MRVESDNLETFWDVLYPFTRFRERLPARAIAADWARILGNWKSLGVEKNEDDEVKNKEVTIESLCQLIQNQQTLNLLGKVLVKGTDGLVTLNQLYELIIQIGEKDSALLIALQSWRIRTTYWSRNQDCCETQELEEDLKDISKLFGRDVLANCFTRASTKLFNICLLRNRSQTCCANWRRSSEL